MVEVQLLCSGEMREFRLGLAALGRSGIKTGVEVMVVAFLLGLLMDLFRNVEILEQFELVGVGYTEETPVIRSCCC